METIFINYKDLQFLTGCALQVIIKGMEGTLSDYEIVSLKETKIMDVFTI